MINSARAFNSMPGIINHSQLNDTEFIKIDFFTSLHLDDCLLQETDLR